MRHSARSSLLQLNLWTRQCYRFKGSDMLRCTQLISITVQQMCLTFQYPMCDRTHSWKLSQVLAIKWQCTLACAASHQYQHAVLVLGSMKIKVVRSSFSSCRKCNQTRVQSVLNVELNVRTVNSRLAVLQDDCKSRIKKNQWAFCIGKIQTGRWFLYLFFQPRLHSLQRVFRLLHPHGLEGSRPWADPWPGSEIRLKVVVSKIESTKKSIDSQGFCQHVTCMNMYHVACSQCCTHLLTRGDTSKLREMREP